MVFNKKTFLIKVEDEHNLDFYQNHGTYHEGDAGLDLFIVEDTMIPPNETVLVDLGISCQSRSFNPCFYQWFTKGMYKYNSYLLMPRSSIYKTPLIVKNSIGLIDSAYTGKIKSPLHNTSNEPFYLTRGDRYLQLVNSDLSPVSFKLTNNHRSTTRGSGGFGSTNNQN